MLIKPQSCSGCPLYIDGRGFSRPEGKYPSKTGLMIIGESLGTKEVIKGLPFRPDAEAGSVLQTVFRILGYDRSDFILWNMIACQPPYNNLENTAYEYEAINHCDIHFRHVITKYKPKAILALGNVPLKHLWQMPEDVKSYIQNLPEDTKEEKAIKKKYLRNFKIGSMRGYILSSIYGIPMIASFHPSFITRDKGRTHLGTLQEDLKAAITLARTGFEPFKSVYDENPTPEKVKDFYNYCKENPALVIAHDIETPMTTLQIDESEIEYENIDVRDIDSVQFSVKEGTGIFIPYYGDDNIKTIKDILSLPNPKVGWNNWKFDEVNLEYHHGKNSIRGQVHDVMWMWKWLNQDFVKTGRALQFATNFFARNFPVWKHLAQLEPQNYGCLDVDATLRIFNGLYKAFTNPNFRFKNPNTGLIELEDTKTVMQGYLDDIVYLREILEDTSDRGFPIDVEQREIFRIKIELERNRTLEELQELYPMHLRRVSPIEGYKFIPKEVHEITEKFNAKRKFNNIGKFILADSDATIGFVLSKLIELRTRPEDDETTGLVIKEFDFQGHKEKRYCRIEKFKPKSSQQVINYLKFKGYKVPKMRDRIKGERESTSKDLLQPLYEETGDGLLAKSIYLRELDHMLDTYVGTGKKEGWRLGSDNRVHTTFTFIPATGQLSSIKPNIQNAPARGTKYSSEGYAELAKQFRRTIAAKAGHVLLSADWSAFHINTLSFEAEDTDYMRVGRIDPHSFLAAEIIKGRLEGGSLTSLKMRKPLTMEEDIWKAKIVKGEEALDRLKNFNQWLLLTDAELATTLKWFKKNYSMTRNSQAKPAILGMGFGMKVPLFYRMNRHTFKSKAEPERILGLMRGRFPKSFVDYHEKIKEMADRQTYLISRYGYVRRFYNVYDWRILDYPKSPRADEKLIKTSTGKYWLRKDGDSANEAIAYFPSNNAFGKKKEAMRDLWNHPNGNLCKAFGLINEIHDDLMFEIEESLVNEAIPIIVGVMESPARFLKNVLCPQGLVTKVEVKVGKNWADMAEVKL